MAANTLLNLPDNFSVQLFFQKYPNLNESDVTCWPGNRLMVHPDIEITDNDLLNCVTVPGPTPPTLMERLEAAELMIDLLLDTQQESA